MGRIAEISMEINELVERGMSAKFISVTLNVPYEWAEQAIQERAEQELLKQYEMQQYAAELEDYSPFDY